MKQKYYYDKEFFTRSTEQSFYWAGFIAADGNISSKGDFTLSLKQSDSEHLKKFIEAIQSNVSVKILPPRKKLINNVHTITSGTAIIRFRSKAWIDSFKKFNITPNKTLTYQIPNEIIEDVNFKHFIRGYFDGDGWFSIKNGTKPRLSWGLCGNYQVLHSIQIYLKKSCQIESLPSIYAQKNIFKCEFQNQHDVLRIVNELYVGSSIYLDRKYEISKLASEFDQNTIILNIPKEKLIESHNRLKSYSLMANEFGCAKSTIAKYMKKFNLIKV